MSEMPRIWWSPSRGWFGEVGRETFAFAPDYDGPGELPGDARRLTVAAGDGAADVEPEVRHVVETWKAVRHKYEPNGTLSPTLFVCLDLLAEKVAR